MVIACRSLKMLHPEYFSLHRPHCEVYKCTFHSLTYPTSNSLTGSDRTNEEAKIPSYHSVSKNTLNKGEYFWQCDMFDSLPEKMNRFRLNRTYGQKRVSEFNVLACIYVMKKEPSNHSGAHSTPHANRNIKQRHVVD
jgi:hypothetical protein